MELITNESVTSYLPSSCTQPHNCEVKNHVAEINSESSRLEKLYEVLLLENGAMTQEQCGRLKQLIPANADVFALSNDELGHTDLVQHHAGTGDSPPIKYTESHISTETRLQVWQRR